MHSNKAHQTRQLALLVGILTCCINASAQVQTNENQQPDNNATNASAPTFQGNVGQVTNVPVPGRMTNQGQNQQSKGASPQANQSAQNNQGNQNRSVQPAANNAPMQTLPSPKLDITGTMINRVAPASTEQIREALEEINRRTGAATIPPTNAFVGRASQYTVDLSPGATPPVVRVAKGMGATVNFVDTAGNPWPIEFANNFYAEAATVTQMAAHVLSVAANSPHLSGSVGVMLKGLTTPVNFVVTPAQSETDFRVDLRITGLSPDAVPVPGRMQSSRPRIGSTVTGQNAPSDDLMGYMYGGTPAGATRLQIELTGSTQLDTRAWQTAGGKLVVRTAALIQSPGWYQRLPALDGTAVYELPPTPVLRVSVGGNTETIRIKGLSPDGESTASRVNANGNKKPSFSPGG